MDAWTGVDVEQLIHVSIMPAPFAEMVMLTVLQCCPNPSSHRSIKACA
jgi:hypothetical protein